MPVAHFADECFERVDLRVRGVVRLAADEHALQRRTIRQVFEYSFEPLAVDDGDLGAGVLEAVLQLLTGPPCIERHRDAAGEQTAEKGRLPFRQIAHGNGDTVALFHARALQGYGDGQRRPREVLVAHALIAIHHEGLAAMRARQPEKLAHGRRRVLPYARAHAANVALLDLERRAGARQQGVGLGQGERGKLFAQNATPFLCCDGLARQVCGERAMISVKSSCVIASASDAIQELALEIWIASSHSLLTMRG